MKLHFYSFSSPLGTLTLQGTDSALTGLYFPDFLPKTENFKENSLFLRAKEEITAYFHGNLQEFHLPLALEGTAFQLSVWQSLEREVSYGTTCTYGELADKMGNSKAIRAVGTACGRNPLPIILPCHRILPKSGGVGQYLGGSEAKAFLLGLEKKNYDNK